MRPLSPSLHLAAVAVSKIELGRTRHEIDVQNGDENADTEDMTVVVFGKTMLASALLAEAPRYDEDDSRRTSSMAWLEEFPTYDWAEPFWTPTRAASTPKTDPSPR